MTIDVHDNNLTKMIMGQEYDTESANMVFEEEDIDWSIMNIKMTIDKSGKQHPSWIYTPLYTRDSIAVSQPLPVSAGEINVTEKTITITGEEVTTTVVETTEVVVPAEVSVDVPAVEAEAAVDVDVVDVAAAAVEVEIPVAKVEYDTVSINEEFDVELGEWQCNESFRLIFDPKGNIRPRIEFLVASDTPSDVVDDAPSTTEVVEVAAVTEEKEVVIAVGVDEVQEETPAVEVQAEVQAEVETEVQAEEPEPATSTEEVVVVERTTVIYDVPETEEVAVATTTTVAADPVPEVPAQPDEMVGAVTVQIEPVPAANLPTGTTFVLPDIRQFGKGIGDFIKDELIDIHILQVLTTNGGINWWADIKGCCKLFPLWTLKNESSLLSAVNFALFGFHNFIPHLQSAMYNLLGNDVINKSIKQRWSYDLWLKLSKKGSPIPNSDDLEKIWQNTIQGSLFDFLGASIKGDDEVIPTTPVDIEPIHIYLLSNLLNRPIIVLSEVEETANKTANSLKGIYIPFEQEPEKCYHFPIVLGYHLRHFTALVATDNRINTLSNVNTPMWIPVSNAYLSLLPVHFTTYPGAEWQPYEVIDPLSIPEVSEVAVIDELVKYLQLVKVRFSKQTYNPPDDSETATDTTTPATDDDDSKRFNFLTAVRTNLNRKPHDYKDMVKSYTKGAKQRHKSMKSKKLQCRSNGCKNIPSSQLKGLCVRCYQRTLLNNVETKTS